MKGTIRITSVLLPLHHLLQWTSRWKSAYFGTYFAGLLLICREPGRVDVETFLWGHCREPRLSAELRVKSSSRLLTGTDFIAGQCAPVGRRGKSSLVIECSYFRVSGTGVLEEPVTLSVRLINSPIKRKRRVAVEIQWVVLLKLSEFGAKWSFSVQSRCEILECFHVRHPPTGWGWF